MSEDNDFITISGNFEEEMNKFKLQMRTLGRALIGAAPVIQNQTADFIAAAYKFWLRDGVGQENSKLTQAIRGVYPPLSGLADHVVVIHVRTGAVGDRQVEAPAYVTFESQEWVKIAILQDKGYIIHVTDKLRGYLFIEAERNGFSKGDYLEEGMSAKGFWEVPARPHLYYLDSDDMDAILRGVAGRVLKGGPETIARTISAMGSKRPEPVAYKPRRMIDSDSIQLSNSGEVSEAGGDE